MSAPSSSSSAALPDLPPKPLKGGCASGGCSSGNGCATGGGMMGTHDWLAYEGLTDYYPAPDIVEVRFKGGRKEFFTGARAIGPVTGDAVVVEAAAGYHIGYVSLSGPLVELQMRKKKVHPNITEVRRLIRLATDEDLAGLALARNRELPALFRTRQIIQALNLDMKLSDVEFQGDGTRATFYYSSEGRVDFRQIVKDLAAEFSIRVDMRQITHRQEAGRIGGIGVCGRELCCSTWINEFKNVTTSAARHQNISLNPARLTGQCGRLKCCLNYELDTYLAELRDIPRVDKGLKTQAGEALLQKTDIFGKRMWFAYRGSHEWVELPVARVNALLAQIKAGQTPLALTEAEEAQLRHREAAADAPLNAELDELSGRLQERDKSRRKLAKKASKARKASAGLQATSGQSAQGNQPTPGGPPKIKRSPQPLGRPAPQGGPKPEGRKARPTDGARPRPTTKSGEGPASPRARLKKKGRGRGDPPPQA